MQKKKLRYIWLWIMGTLILAVIFLTIYDWRRLMESNDLFRLFMRVIITFLITVSFIFQIKEYKKEQNQS